MAEVGCLKDGCFQNLQVEGQTQLSNTNFRRKVRIGVFATNAMTVASTESGGIITIPTTGAASTITLPLISASLSGFNVTFIAAADNGAHTITLQQGANAQGTGAASATIFFGILTAAGATPVSLVGTASAVIDASKFKKGDQIEIICDGTNYIIRAFTITAAGVTVS